uniref:Uncharacterized protein n=1 Tax=viral metagenome TaxID=1070528 RepID=A0A6C0J514_9ZZZZ
MEDSTSLDMLMSPQGPQSQPPLMPMPSSPGPTQGPMAPTFKPTMPQMTFMFRNLRLYVCFFLAAALISLSAPRTMLLQYIPNAYTSGGVVSWTGAAVLGGSAVVIAHFINVFIASMGL